jgi:hypothetical protein
MPRTYRTLSLSLPPEAVVRLEGLGRAVGKTGARVAAEIVLRDLSMSEPFLDSVPTDQGDTRMLLHDCVVHERDARGMFSRQYQTLSLVDIKRIRGGRVGVFEVFIDGEWLEVEGKIDEFRSIWEQAKAASAGIS